MGRIREDAVIPKESPAVEEKETERKEPEEKEPEGKKSEGREPEHRIKDGTGKELIYQDFAQRENEEGRVNEGVPAYMRKKQGEYTVEDYYKLPEDARYELIDGVFYDMPLPLTIHQAMIGRLFARFDRFLSDSRGECEVFLSPFDVQLDEDDRTMVQPDLVVNCSRDRVTRRGIFGAPDLLIEILSPSTRQKDMVLKLKKYEQAGVREYWMIDPEEKTVAVYYFHDSHFPKYHTFEDRVPVNIWGGRLAVDFAAVWEEIGYIADL